MGILEKVGAWFVGAAVETPRNVMRLAEASYGGVDADEDQWRRLTDDHGRDMMPLSQDRMREMARYLWEQNLLGNRLIELPLAYLLAEGVKLDAGDEAMQEVLDAFWCDPINAMNMKLPRKVREMALYGEQCWPAFVNEVDGHVRLGYLDPARIATVVADPDNPEQPVGIVTVKDRKGVSKRYRVIINGPEDVFTLRTQEIRRTFADGDCFFFAVNDLSCGMRGRSDLLSQADWLDAYDTYLIGEMERANMLRSYIWDVTLTGADEAGVKDFLAKTKTPAPGSVRAHNESVSWKAEAPSLNAADSSEMARLFRNHALGGATIPEHWFGGGGDTNRAVGAEMSEPTFKVMSMRQRTWKHILESVARYVIRQKLMAGGEKEPEWNDERLEVEAVFPELTARDTTKYAAALQQVVAACAQAVSGGYVTKLVALTAIAAIAGRLGVEIDVDKELENASKEFDERKDLQNDADVFKTPLDEQADGGSQATAGTPGNMPATRQPAHAND